MEFMGISIGILALICTAMLLFGRTGTVKILACRARLTSACWPGYVWTADKSVSRLTVASHGPGPILRQIALLRRRRVIYSCGLPLSECKFRFAAGTNVAVLAEYLELELQD